MLRRAAASEGTVEEDFLNSRLLMVQMWMVYWIVHGCISVGESVLLLPYLPLYSTARLLVSAWLVFPIVVSNARLSKLQALSALDLQLVWVDFSGQGCGLVYFQYVKPLMEGNVRFFDAIDLDSVMASVGNITKIPVSVFSRALTGTNGSYVQGLASYSMSFFASREAKTSAPETTEEADDEYDMVDTPTMASVEGLTQRKVESGKRSWFW